MPRYFVQKHANPEQFEQVDEYVFQHRHEARQQQQGRGDAPWLPRYSNFAIIVDEDGGIEFVGDCKLPKLIFTIVARFLGIKPDGVQSKPDGYLQEPTAVTLLLRGKQEVLHVIGGDNYVRQPVKKKTVAAQREAA